MSSTTITTTPKRTWKRKLFTSSSKSKRARTIVRVVRPSSIVRGPIPKNSMVAMTYFTHVVSPGTVYSQKLFNLNSIYSPEYTGGHQPYGYDTYATLYNRYRVMKVEYMVRVVNNATALGAAFSFALVPTNNPTPYTDDDLAYESPLARHDIVQQGRDKFMSGTYFPGAICGASAVEYKSDDRYQALIGATPTENIILHLVASGLNGTAVPANNLSFSVKLRYFCILSDRKDLAQS